MIQRKMTIRRRSPRSCGWRAGKISRSEYQANEDLRERNLSSRVALDDFGQINAIRDEVTDEGVEAVGSTACEATRVQPRARGRAKVTVNSQATIVLPVERSISSPIISFSLGYPGLANSATTSRSCSSSSVTSR